MSAPLRLRLDAVALTSFAALSLFAFALATYPPLTGLRARVPEASPVIAPVANALGFAAIVLALGWFCLTVLYVKRRGIGRLFARCLGWLILIATSATAIDTTAHRLTLPPASAYGPGGSIGAYLRFFLDDRAVPYQVLIIVGFVGVLLAADNLIRSLLRIIWIAVRGIAIGAKASNRFVENRTNYVIESIQKKREERAAVVNLTPMETVPIPIHKPPELRLVPRDDDEPNEIPIERAPLMITRPAIAETETVVDFELPPLTLLNDPDAFAVEDHESKLRERAVLLEKTFTDFGLTIKVVGIHTGPVITQYEISLETGLRLSKVTTLSDDLALKLKVSSVRIVAPLPGRDTVGIEVPNEHRQTVRLKELIAATTAKASKMKLPIFVGKDVEGRALVYDLATMPHLLIAGRTGTGKSVCLNAIILSLLYTRKPDECRMIMIDPKKVELSEYGKIPHLMHPVVTDDKKAEAILAWAVDKMEERYEWLRRARVRNIASFNELGTVEILRRIDPVSEDERKAVPRSMPYIVIIIDEVGDLLMSMKKEVESHIIRLAQKSRAAGIHIMLATQKPTVDVITGLIKSNLPARICFQVASRADSAVVLDEKGADKLLGMGDMLFLQPGTSTIIRAQGAYVDDGEIERTVTNLECDEPNYESELLNLKAKDTTSEGGASLGEKLRERDPIYEQAVEIVIREQRGSTSLLQRALGIGYGKASRFIDFMAEDGIVGGFNGSNAREVLVSSDEWETRKQAAG